MKSVLALFFIFSVIACSTPVKNEGPLTDRAPSADRIDPKLQPVSGAIDILKEMYDRKALVPVEGRDALFEYGLVGMAGGLGLRVAGKVIFIATTADYMIPLVKAASAQAGKPLSNWQILQKLVRSKVAIFSGGIPTVTLNGRELRGAEKFVYLARYSPQMVKDFVPATAKLLKEAVRPALAMLNSSGMKRPLIGGISGGLVNLGGRLVFVSSGVAVAIAVFSEAISKAVVPQAANAGEFSNSLLGSVKGFEFIMSMSKDRLLENVANEPELRNALVNLASAVTAETVAVQVDPSEAEQP